MVKICTALKPLSGEGTKNVPRTNHSLNDDSRCLHTSSNFFYSNFCSIHGLRSNLIWNTTSPLLNLIFFPHQEPVVSGYWKQPLLCSLLLSLFSFSIWSWLLHLCTQRHNLLLCPCPWIFCAPYRSPNSSDYLKFFQYLTSKVEHILTNFPYAEISILGDFNVHHQLWLSSCFTDQPGEQPFNFAIIHDLE